MRYKLFGRTGLRVSELCLGTMTFGMEWGWGSTKEESKSVFDTYVEAGGNFIDTANFYTGGTSERYLSEFIADKRESLVLATKYTLTTDPKDPNASGNHRKNMMQAVNASLKRLNTDYIDILWVHAWDKYTPVDEMMRSLDDIVRQGKVLYVGVSDTPAWVVSQATTMAELKGWSPFAGLQLEYSLIMRDIEREYFEMAQNLDLAIAAWSPLGGGVLTGKYLNGQPGNVRYQGDDFFTKRALTERNQAIAKEVANIAKEIGKAPIQVSLNWVRQKSPRLIPIVGARTAAQLKGSLGSLNFTLDDASMKKLDDASSISIGFPHDFLTSSAIIEKIYGEKFSLIDNHR